MGYAIIDPEGKVLRTSKAPIVKRMTWGKRISYISDRPVETFIDHGSVFHSSKGNSKGKATRCGINAKNGLLYFYRIEVVGNVSKNVEEIIGKLEHRLGAEDI